MMPAKPTRAAIQEILQSNDSTRNKIDTLETELRKLPQIEIETTHRFAEGLYAREIFIPKDTLLTGKIHKFEHINFITKGEISVLTEDGVKRIKAPFTMVSRPGTKRVGYAHEDTIWTTVHATSETDPEKAEAALVVDSFDDLTIEEIKKLEIEKCHT